MQNNYYLIYEITNSSIGRTIRIFLIISFLFLFLFIKDTFFLQKILGVFTLIVINELFLRSLSKRKIDQKISFENNSSSIKMSFTTNSIFTKEKTSFSLVSIIQNDKEAKFFLEKLGVPISFSDLQIDKNKLALYASSLIQKMNYSYIVPFDLFVSYLLLSEEKTNFLKDNFLKEEDIIVIAYWTRRKFRVEEDNKFLEFTGSGVFETLVYGWNYEVKKYSQDFTQKVLSQSQIPSIAGRNEEYDKFLLDLSKSRANNVLLIGDPGIGKANLVSYFTYHSHIGDVPEEIAHKRVFELFADRILAGTDSPGEIEERLGFLLSDITHAGNTVIFIQNIEVIFGGGGMNFDLSGVLYEYLENRNIQIIGTTTKAAFSTYLSNKKTVSSLFETILLEEPDEENALLMLIENVVEIEKQYSISITYPALKEIVNLSSSYSPQEVLPGKGIELMDEAANAMHLKNKKLLEKKDITDLVERKTHIVLSEPSKNEKEILLKLEEELHKRVIGQEKAVKAVASALRRLRSGFVNDKRPISAFLFLGPTGVGKTEMAKTLAVSYFGSEDNMIRFDMSEFQNQDQIERLLGEEAGEAYVSGSLVEKVRDNPFSLVLLDEFEKAHPRLLDLFLQVFDEGKLTDNKGESVSFTNTIIIATSNAGSEYIREEIKSGTTKEILEKKLIDVLLKQNNFKPELINRFDEIVIFNPLKKEEIKKIASLILSASLKKLEEKQIFIKFEDSVLEKIVKNGFSEDFGARNIRRYIQNTVEEYLANEILSEKIKKRSNIILGIDDKEDFVLK